jgi:hypothetical protein
MFLYRHKRHSLARHGPAPEATTGGLCSDSARHIAHPGRACPFRSRTTTSWSAANDDGDGLRVRCRPASLRTPSSGGSTQSRRLLAVFADDLPRTCAAGSQVDRSAAGAAKAALTVAANPLPPLFCTETGSRTSMRKFLRRPSPAILVASAALFAATAGVSYAAVTTPHDPSFTSHGVAFVPTSASNGVILPLTGEHVGSRQPRHDALGALGGRAHRGHLCPHAGGQLQRRRHRQLPEDRRGQRSAREQGRLGARL